MSIVSPLLLETFLVFPVAIFSLIVVALLAGLAHRRFGGRAESGKVVVLSRVGNFSEVSTTSKCLLLARSEDRLHGRLAIRKGCLIATLGRAGSEIVSVALLLASSSTLAVLHLADGADFWEIVSGVHNSALVLVAEDGLATELHLTFAALRLDGNAARETRFLRLLSLVVKHAPSLANALSFFLLAALFGFDLLAILDGSLVVAKGEVGFLLVGALVVGGLLLSLGVDLGLFLSGSGFRLEIFGEIIIDLGVLFLGGFFGVLLLEEVVEICFLVCHSCLTQNLPYGIGVSYVFY